MYPLKVSFLILHALGSIWEDKRLLTSNKEEIKHAAKILKLLEAVQAPLQVAVMHCPGHQKDRTEVARESNLAERATRGC